MSLLERIRTEMESVTDEDIAAVNPKENVADGPTIVVANREAQVFFVLYVRARKKQLQMKVDYRFANATKSQELALEFPRVSQDAEMYLALMWTAIRAQTAAHTQPTFGLLLCADWKVVAAEKPTLPNVNNIMDLLATLCASDESEVDEAESSADTSNRKRILQ